MQSSPPPLKSDQEIAEQLESEIGILKKEQQK